MGHCVETFFYGPEVGEFYGKTRHDVRRARNDELLRMARRAAEEPGGLQLIFCYVYDDFLEPQAARKLAALGVPMVNMNVDMVNQWYRQSQTARYFTAILCAQKENMSALASCGATTLYFPMAARLPADQSLDPTTNPFEPAAPVTFVGTPMPTRTRVLKYLLDSGVPLAVYGKYWQELRGGHTRPPVGKDRIGSAALRFMRFRHEGPGALARALGGATATAQRCTTNGAARFPPARIPGPGPDGAVVCALKDQSRIHSHDGRGSVAARPQASEAARLRGADGRWLLPR